jgi:hypothetical protein
LLVRETHDLVALLVQKRRAPGIGCNLILTRMSLAIELHDQLSSLQAKSTIKGPIGV